MGFYLNQVDLKNTQSLEEVVNRVKEFDAENNTDFIIGRGWDQNDWNIKSFPTNTQLNEIFPNKPVILRRIDGHAYLVNDYSLKLAGINNLTKVDGGEILKIGNNLTGVLIDNSMRLIDDIIPEPTKEESTKALLSAQDLAFKNGLTTISDAGLTKNQIELIDELQKEGALKIKIYAMIENDSISLEHFLQLGP